MNNLLLNSTQQNNIFDKKAGATKQQNQIISTYFT